MHTKDAKGKVIHRRYYFDMKKALTSDDDRDEAVLSVPEDGLVKSFQGEIQVDVTTPEREYEHDLFPVNRVFRGAEWRYAYSKYWNYAQEKMRLYDRFEQEVIKRFEQYQVPVIELKKETPKEAVCLVFERVNTGGVALTVFELLTASFAASGYQLRDDWNARERRLKDNHPVLRSLQSDGFLQAVSLLVTMSRRREARGASGMAEAPPAISCKRKDILKLEVEDWTAWADRVEKGFVQAARFLHGQKIFNERDLPYRTQLVPLAAIFVDLGRDGETEGAREKIARWYWCGVLGALYGSALETRFARDLPEVVAWVRGEGGGELTTVQEAHFQTARLNTLRTRNSAAYKGIYALLMREGCRDLRSGEPIDHKIFFDDRIDIHHIFPENWCKRKSIDGDIYNTIVNKTALSARTNRVIGGRAPSLYVASLEREAGVSPTKMDGLLRSHCIAPHLLRADDFWGFDEARREELLWRIEDAMGKTIPRTREGGARPSAKSRRRDRRSGTRRTHSRRGGEGSLGRCTTSRRPVTVRDGPGAWAWPTDRGGERRESFPFGGLFPREIERPTVSERKRGPVLGGETRSDRRASKGV